MRTSEADARKRILDAAEELMSHDGLGAVDLSAVAARAGVGEAAVRRAFGSASDLAREVFARNLDPLDEERLRLLRCAESLGPSGRPSVNHVLQAYMVPWIRFWQASRPLLVLYARHAARSPGAPALPMRPQERQVAGRFTSALARALPGMPSAWLAWRLQLIRGAILGLWADPEEATRRSGGLCTFDDVEAVIQHLVSFAEAGLEPGRYGHPSRRPIAGGPSASSPGAPSSSPSDVPGRARG